MNEGSFDCDISKTLAMPIAGPEGTFGVDFLARRCVVTFCNKVLYALFCSCSSST